MGAPKKVLKIFLISLSNIMALVILFFSAVYIYINFFFSFCEVENFGATLSPNGKASVVIYAINCGAGTRFNTRAALAPAKKDFDPEHGKQFLHVRGQHGFHVEWIDAATVEVIASDAAEAYGEGNVVQKENSVDGVAISYR